MNERMNAEEKRKGQIEYSIDEAKAKELIGGNDVISRLGSGISLFTALEVDAELSTLVKRKFSLVSSSSPSQNGVGDNATTATATAAVDGGDDDVNKTILQTEYRATTDRMLRVAVNGFMESLGVVLQVMQELDSDVLVEKLGVVSGAGDDSTAGTNGLN